MCWLEIEPENIMAFVVAACMLHNMCDTCREVSRESWAEEVTGISQTETWLGSSAGTEDISTRRSWSGGPCAGLPGSTYDGYGS